MSAELARLGAAPSEPPLSALGSTEDTNAVDLSVVMPCLNEEGSVGICVRKAWEGIHSAGLAGEVIVADNGSDDNSVAVAEAAGARIIHQARRGYGHAYLAGFAAARGRIIVMGDSDDSYDFTKIPELIDPIARGYDYVLGSRFAGRIHPGAMTWSHRRIGNPLLTGILNALFGLKVSDAHSGFRAITRAALDRIELRCGGMELASEIVVKAAHAALRTAEVPITYHPRVGVSKLNSIRDAWRHLRFLFLLSPDYLFLGPGAALTGLGLLGQLVLLAVPGSPAVLLGKIALALLTLGGGQLLELGAFGERVGADHPLSRGPALRLLDRIGGVKRSPVPGITIAVAGLSLAAAPLLAGSAASIAAGGAASSLAIFGLLMTVLGSRLWFNALFLRLILARQEMLTARPGPQP